MATRFQEEAAAQLNPYFDQQQQAVQQQLPAIQQLYDTLLSGLEGQRQTETQNILESASQRGVLRSSMPVDLQTQLGAALLAQRGQLESQRAGDVANVNKSLADIGLQRSQSISSLADALQARDLQERQFQLQQQQAEREYQLSVQKMQQEAAARASSNASSKPSATQAVLQYLSSGYDQGRKKTAKGAAEALIPLIAGEYGMSKQDASSLVYTLRKQYFNE